ncbi:MAG TPA: hypothetical protein VFI70_11575 [Nitrososphaeraceae archaeon]|nr:hypothetical protein [Nitrososphaeraceae archaeon]
MASKYVMPPLVLIMVIILSQVLFQHIFALSPQISMEGINLRPDDWKLKIDDPLTVNNITKCRDGQQHIPFPSIQAVSYYSDGKTLYTTLWLSSQFKEINSTENYRDYGSFIIPDSVYSLKNQSYETKISWNHHQPMAWTLISHILSPIAGFDKLLRLEHQEINHTNFYESGKNYVDLSLDLGAMGYPSRYSVVSYTTEQFFTKKGPLCTLIDVTDLVHIPPPEFVMSTLPNSLVLRAGDESNIELQLKSNTTLPSNVSLSTDSTKGISSTIVPKNMSVSPLGVAISNLHIKALNNATIQHTHLLRINAKITIPITVTNMLSGKALSSPFPVRDIIKNIDFIITIQSPLSFQDKLHDFLNTWFNPLTASYSTIASIITGILGWRIGKRQKKKRLEQVKHDRSSPTE